MKYIDIKDILPNKYYVVEFSACPGWDSIFWCTRADKLIYNESRLWLSGTYHHSNREGWWSNNTTGTMLFREATAQEIAWYRACRKANKSLPKEDYIINELYSIY